MTIFQEIIQVLQRRSLVQKQIEELSNVQHCLDQDEEEREDHLQNLDSLFSQKSLLDQKIFNHLQKQVQFQQYFNEGYSTQFRQCFNYFEYQELSLHQKLFEQDCFPEYFYIILKGKIGLFSRSQLYHGQHGYQYSGNHLVKINDQMLAKQNQVQDSTPKRKREATPKSKADATPSSKVAGQLLENQYYLIKIIGEGQQLGEMSILMDINRTTSAIAYEDNTVVLRLDYQKFMEILRIREESKLYINLSFIKESSSINFLSFNALKDIFVKSYTVRFKRDQQVCLQGQYPQAAYMIQSGEFSLWSQANLNSNKQPPVNQPYQTTLPKYHIKQDIKMSLLGVKEIFGDIEILSKQNYKYSLKCESEGDIIIIPRQIYETKVMQNDLLIDIVKNKSSKINQKRLTLYKRFTQNLEVFRHFMYDADDTDEEDSGKIIVNKGYEVFKKSKQFKNFVNQEKSIKNNQSIDKKDKVPEQQIQKPPLVAQQSNGQQMKELIFLENVNCYELNNQDKKNFYFTYKGRSQSNKSSINSSNDLHRQGSSVNQQKDKQNKKDHSELYQVFQTDCPLQAENQLNSLKNTSRQDILNNSNNHSRSQLDDSSMLRSVFYRNHPPRPSSKISSCDARRRIGSFSILGEQNKEISDLLKGSENQVLDQGLKIKEDQQSYSPSHSIGMARQIQEELISQLSQRLGKDDHIESSQSPGRKTSRVTSREQRRIIKQLQKQNQDLFNIKIDPKLKQKMIGYNKNQNFIADYREQCLELKRNSLHSNQILRQLNYSPNKIQEFTKLKHLQEAEEDQKNFQFLNQSNLNQILTGNQSQRGRNLSLPQSQQSYQNQQFVPYSRRQSSKGKPQSQLQEQNVQHDYQFLLARIDDSQTQTPQTAPSSKTGNQSLGQGRTKLHGFQFINSKKPQTALPLPQRKSQINKIPNQSPNNPTNKSRKQPNRESNSSFGTSQTMNSEIDGFDKSNISFEITGYDINQYRQDRIKSQSFSLNIMNSLEAGQQHSNNLVLNNSKILTSKAESPFISRRQTFNCITNQVLDKQQQQNQNIIQQQRPPTGKQKPQAKNERSQQILGKKTTVNSNTNSEKNEQIPETLIGNQIHLKRKDMKSSSSSRQKSLYNQDQTQNHISKNKDEKEYLQNQNYEVNSDEYSNTNFNNIKIKNSFNLSGQPKGRLEFQKSRQNSKDKFIRQQQNDSGVQLNDSSQRYISFDFRPPSFINE